jgi:type I restriction enzyme S subunit
MNNILGNAAYYSQETISTSKLNLSSYITTDSLLANKQGKCDSVNLPPNSEKCIRFKKGDILVANIRPYLKKIWLADIDGGCSADVLVFKSKEGYLPSFLYYALLRDDFFIHSMKGSKGTKMPRGDKDHLLEFLIPNFNYVQQEKISQVLSILDAKIILNKNINIELEAMTKLIYDYWFVQFDFPDENGRPYKSSGGKMVFNEDLKREIPYGWKVQDFGVANEIRRGDLITSDTIRNGNVKLVSAGVESSHFHDQSNRSANVITVSSSGANAGYVNFWREPIFASDCITVQATSVVETVIAFQFLKMIQNHIYRKASGSAQPHVYTSDLFNLKYLLPPKKVIDLFERKLISSNDLIGCQNQENDKLKELRDWLLPMLMNGQVTVSETS